MENKMKKYVLTYEFFGYRVFDCDTEEEALSHAEQMAKDGATLYILYKYDEERKSHTSIRIFNIR